MISYPLNSQTNLRFSLKEFHKRAISTHYQIKVQRRGMKQKSRMLKFAS
jgi:hypothetical protein